MRCTGGEVGATSALAPKIGPLGLVSVEIFTNQTSLPPLCRSVRVTEYNPVEAQIKSALGNRAARTHGQLCAEKSGTQSEAPTSCYSGRHPKTFNNW